MEIKVTAYEHPADTGRSIVASFDDSLQRHMPGAILREIVERIAEQFVKENYSRIVGAIGDECVSEAAADAVRVKVKQILEVK